MNLITNTNETKIRGNKIRALKEKQEDDNDLFELLGCCKYSNKKNFDYEEIIDQMDESSKVLIEKSIQDRLNSQESRPSVNLDQVSNSTIDWRKGGFYSMRYTQGCFILFVFSFLSFVTGVIYFEFDYNLIYYDYVKGYPEYSDLTDKSMVDSQLDYIKANMQAYKLISQASLVILFLLSVLTVLNFITMHSEYIEWKKAIKLLPEDATFTNTKGFKSFLLHCFLLLIHPYFFLNDELFKLSVNYNIRSTRINYIFLTFFLPLRFWYVIKYFIVSSYYYSPRAQRFASMYQTQVNLSFSIKCILKSYPLITLIILFGSTIFLGGYLIRIWERPGAIQPNEGLESVQNCAWYAFITMSTVGYGDFMATSIPSRGLAVAVGISGVFVNSILTVVLTENFTFQGGELKAYNMLNQIELKEDLDIVIKKLYTKCMLINHCRFKRAKFSGEPKLMKKVDDLQASLLRERDNLMKKVKEVKEEIKASFEIDPIDMVIDKLSDVMKSVNLIKSKINQFESVFDTAKENQRNLEALKNTILSIDEKEE